RLNRTPFLPALAILFAASGAAALIYEIVWYQLLEFAIGSTALSLAVLLATFMGGLCLRSPALPRLAPLLPPGLRHPLRLYGAIELVIGIVGVLELALIPLVARAYVAGAEAGLPGMALRGGLAAICLLPPTALMGASLPALVRFVSSRVWWGVL